MHVTMLNPIQTSPKIVNGLYENVILCTGVKWYLIMNAC